MNHPFVLVSSNVGVLSSVLVQGGNRGVCKKESCVLVHRRNETSRLTITSAEGNLASKTQCVPGGALPGGGTAPSQRSFHKPISRELSFLLFLIVASSVALSQSSSAFELFWAGLTLIFDGRENCIQKSHKTLETSPVLGHHEADNPQPFVPMPLIYPIRKHCSSAEGLHINVETVSITYTRTESFLCF